MAMYDDPADTRRRKNIVPRSRSFFPAASRFMGGLEPSPTGSYFNPARYGHDLTPSQLRFAQRNLANVYNQDVQFNRVANPRFQTEQDIGTSATSPFGSGRAMAATTQEYARRYGRDIGGGLRTFETPSGGSITYRPTARQLAGGIAGGGVKPFSVYMAPELARARQAGYGDVPVFHPETGTLASGGVQTPIEQLSTAQRFQYGVPTLAERFREQPFSTSGRLLGQLGTLGYNAFASLFRPRQQTQPDQSGYADNSEPRRYFDF